MSSDTRAFGIAHEDVCRPTWLPLRPIDIRDAMRDCGFEHPERVEITAITVEGWRRKTDEQ